MSYNDVRNEYFRWLYKFVCGDRYAKGISFRKLLRHLHETEFTWLIPMDENRACDGIDLRYRFAYEYSSPATAESYLDGPCSILEMMVALAIRCEDFMDDPQIGDRTGQWFWGMINSLGLGSMVDDRYDEEYVDDVIERFLNREYAPNGKGGLFTVRRCTRDLRDVEIWYQMTWYTGSVS